MSKRDRRTLQHLPLFYVTHEEPHTVVIGFVVVRFNANVFPQTRREYFFALQKLYKFSFKRNEYCFGILLIFLFFDHKYKCYSIDFFFIFFSATQFPGNLSSIFVETLFAINVHAFIPKTPTLLCHQKFPIWRRNNCFDFC